MKFKGDLKSLIKEAVEILEEGYHPPEAHPEGDVLTHTLYVLKLLKMFNANKTLMLAGLLHDIGKDESNYIGMPIPKGKSKHATIGAEKAKELLRKYNFPPEVIADVSWLIDHHMILRDWNQLTTSEKSAIAHHPRFEDLYYLTIADWIARFIPDIVNWYLGKDKPQMAQPEASREIKQKRKK